MMISEILCNACGELVPGLSIDEAALYDIDCVRDTHEMYFPLCDHCATALGQVIA